MQNSSSGFTLIELMIVLGITAAFTLVGILNLTGFNDEKALESEAKSAQALLVSAQVKARSQDENSRWGVYFDNTVTPATYSLYKVDETKVDTDPFPFAVGGITTMRSISGQIALSAPALATSTNIMFNKGTGAPNLATSIVFELSNNPSIQETVVVASSGLIQF